MKNHIEIIKKSYRNYQKNTYVIQRCEGEQKSNRLLPQLFFYRKITINYF